MPPGSKIFKSTSYNYSWQLVSPMGSCVTKKLVVDSMRHGSWKSVNVVAMFNFFGWRASLAEGVATGTKIWLADYGAPLHASYIDDLDSGTPCRIPSNRNSISVSHLQVHSDVSVVWYGGTASNSFPQQWLESSWPSSSSFKQRDHSLALRKYHREGTTIQLSMFSIVRHPIHFAISLHCSSPGSNIGLNNEEVIILISSQLLTH